MARVAILGCGPAGLLAAHAAHIMRVDVDILSIPEKSTLNGAQFLHTEIPHLTGEPDGVIHTFKLGTKQGYAAKVYGDPEAPCSWDAMTDDDIKAWSLRDTYETLWGMYGDMVCSLKVDSGKLPGLLEKYDLVISTIPAPLTCMRIGPHVFEGQIVHFTDESQVDGIQGNYIVYNGSPSQSWYRSSSLFGVKQTEYGQTYNHKTAHSNGNAPNVTQGLKPLVTNCDCFPGLLRVGRFGQWRRGVLTHHAFQEAANALHKL